MTNALYYGDNLDVLRGGSIAPESVDLIYLDPPFNSNASYNVLFKAPSGEQSQAQIEAFEDTWHWNDTAELAFNEVVTGPHSDAAIMLRAMRSALGENDMMAYLAMMAVRLIELHRVLKPTGSLYLHCDPTASHYLKVLLDAIFGAELFRSEIVWKRSSAHSDTKQGRRIHGHIHDVIFFYTKNKDWTWNEVYTPYADAYVGRDYRLVDEDTGRHFRRGDLTAARPGGDTEYEWRVKKHEGASERWEADPDDEYLNPKPGWEYKGVYPYKSRYWAYSKDNMRQFAQEGRLRHTFEGMPEYKRYLDEMLGVPLQDLWTDIPPIIAGTAERLGYPTQKPVALLERIVSASSNEGDLVLDPFCGCGTTVHAAQKLNRRWIGIDITHLAIALIERRLREAFPGIVYDVHGVPKDEAGARDLAERDKHQFQMWITATIGVQPYKGGKKGMDRGIDGYLHFRDADKKPQFAIVSVKGGEHINSAMIRDLKGTMEREKAALGLFLTLNAPTREMEREAASAGLYETGGMKVPRLQILTAAQILDNRRPQVPFGFTEGFRKAAREDTGGQERLL
jgi:site-specific DNA-methyltransferase (adenine-specific)